MVETRRVLLADAFALEPLGGIRTAVVPDGTGVDAAAVVDELGAPAVLREGDSLRVEGTTPERAALAAFGALRVADEVETGEHGIEINGEERTVEVTETGAWVGASMPEWTTSDADGAAALGVEGNDLLDAPVGSADGRTVVGTEFLSALEGQIPEGTVGYTFETMSAEAHVAVRAGGAEPTGIRGCLAVAAALDAVEAFDGAFPDPLVCEVGRLGGRPGEVWVSPGRVGGPVAVALDGTLAVRAADDDIVVA